MIVFKYVKQNGAEYLPHLDTLRAIIRTLRRAEIPVAYSKGFNPHMLLKMTPPMPLGVTSVCEYCAAETDIEPRVFAELYNARCVKGLECVKAYKTRVNPNLAANITAAKYHIRYGGIVEIADRIKSGDIPAPSDVINKNIGEYIIDIAAGEDGAFVKLKFGNRGNLRIDAFLGAFNIDICDCEVVKTEMYCGDKTADEFIEDYCDKRYG
jgi:radical SAM-linked protein